MIALILILVFSALVVVIGLIGVVRIYRASPSLHRSE
jgi:hypothetical protein